jgi:hypothetical protein
MFRSALALGISTLVVITAPAIARGCYTPITSEPSPGRTYYFQTNPSTQNPNGGFTAVTYIGKVTVFGETLYRFQRGDGSYQNAFLSQVFRKC